MLFRSGRLDEMEAVAANAPRLAGRAKARADRAAAMRITPAAFDVAAARDEFARLTGVVLV